MKHSKCFAILFALLGVTLSYNMSFAQTPFWQRMNEPTGTDPLIIRSLWINSNDEIYASIDFKGLFRSTDFSSSWDSTGLTNVIVTALGVTSDSLLFAGVYQVGLYRSTDKAITWDKIDTLRWTINCITADANGFVYVAPDRFIVGEGVTTATGVGVG